MREGVTGDFSIEGGDADAVVLHWCGRHEALTGEAAVVDQGRFGEGVTAVVLGELVIHCGIAFPLFVLLHCGCQGLLLFVLLLLSLLLLGLLLHLVLLLLERGGLAGCGSRGLLLSFLDDVFWG